MSGTLQFILLAVFFLLAWAAASRPRQWFHIPARRQVRRALPYEWLVVQLPLFCWLVLCLLTAYALTHPSKVIRTSQLVEEKRIFVICLDASHSMGEGSTTAPINRIKRVSSDFAAKREGDAMGVVAYSGTGSREFSRGNAHILMRPTSDLSLVRLAIAAVTPSMFGTATAVGDGIFISIMALISADARVAMGADYDRALLQASVESWGTDHENIAYAQRVAEAIGPQNGKFILLFTDGKSNIGMSPNKPLWFARRIGIRVHFIRYDKNGQYSGTTTSEQQIAREQLIAGVVRTGGIYLEGDDLATMPRLFAMVDKAEPRRVRTEDVERNEDARYPDYYLAMAAFLTIWLVVERLKPSVP